MKKTLVYLVAWAQSLRSSCHLQALQTVYAQVWELLGSFVGVPIDLLLTRRNRVESLPPEARASRAKIRSARHFVRPIFVVSGRALFVGER
jgi:hypothetical protein